MVIGTKALCVCVCVCVRVCACAPDQHVPELDKVAVVLVLHLDHAPGVETPADTLAVHFQESIASDHSKRHSILEGEGRGGEFQLEGGGGGESQLEEVGGGGESQLVTLGNPST